MAARFWIGGVRPILMATYWANYLVSGTRPFSYHAVNIALHIIATVLVYLVLGRLLGIARRGTDIRWSAFFGAGVFLVHPLQTESVDYVAGRSEVLCAIFVLSAWLIFLRRFEERTGVGTALQVLVFAAAAVLSKESGICLAAILLATDFFWNDNGLIAQIRKRMALYLPILLGSSGAAFLILLNLGSSTSAGFGLAASPAAYAFTQCRVILLYLRLFLAPAGQNVDWQIQVASSFRDKDAWVYVIGLAILITATVWLYNRAREVSFGLVFFLIALAPTSSFIPIQDAMAERRMYLPIVGLVIAVPGMMRRFRIPDRQTGPLALATLLLLAWASNARSYIWSGDALLWADAVSRNPRNSRAHASLGAAQMMHHKCSDAVGEYRTVLALEGLNDVDGRNLAAAYECSGQTEPALQIYRRLVAIKPATDAYTRIGYLEALHENVDASLAAFGDALRLDPNNAGAYAFRGVARLATNDIAAARDDFRHALMLDPANPVASTWMAKLPPE